MKPLSALTLGFLRDERGATAVEYSLIAGIVSMAMIVFASRAGPTIANIFQRVASELAG